MTPGAMIQVEMRLRKRKREFQVEFALWRIFLLVQSDLGFSAGVGKKDENKL